MSSSAAPRRIPYGRQWIEDDDVQAVVDVLRGDWLTTGPKVGEFEVAFAKFVQAREAVAVSSGTAALHAAVYALGLKSGDEVIVPAMTFAASANAAVYQGATPVFADVDPDTLLLDLNDAERRVTKRTRAVVAVDYAGQPCDSEALDAFARRHGLQVISDACHALGAADRGRPAGTLAKLTAFSLHPVKHLTTGEGGMITTDDAELARRMRLFRNHGISTDHRQREQQGSWFYEMVDLGYNYRITDFQCALGLSQLRKQPRWLDRRGEIARRYGAAFAGTKVRPLSVRAGVRHAYHLYVVRVENRDAAFAALREAGLGVNVHYVPVHLHPFYRDRFGTGEGACPNAEAAYRQILSLPMFPKMSDADVDYAIEAVKRVCGG